MPKVNNGKFDKLCLLFQSVIALSNHEGDLVWSRFSAFIVTHAILFAFIGVLLDVENRNIPIWSVATVGLIITFLWLLSTKRGFEAIEYWNYCAREIEESILDQEKKGGNDILNLYIRGEKYFKLNQQVRFSFGDRKEKLLQRGCLTRCIPLHTRWTAYLSIGLILFSYLAIVFLDVIRFFSVKTG